MWEKGTILFACCGKKRRFQGPETSRWIIVLRIWAVQAVSGPWFWQIVTNIYIYIYYNCWMHGMVILEWGRWRSLPIWDFAPLLSSSNICALRHPVCRGSLAHWGFGLLEVLSGGTKSGWIWLKAPQGFWTARLDSKQLEFDRSRRWNRSPKPLKHAPKCKSIPNTVGAKPI